MARINIELHVDESGAVKGIETTEKGMQSVQREVDETESSMLSMGRTLETAFGFILANIAQRISNGLRNLQRQIYEIGLRAEEAEGKYVSVFRNMRDETDQFIDSWANLAGVTRIEAMEMLSQWAALGVSMNMRREEAAMFAREYAKVVRDFAIKANVDLSDSERALNDLMLGRINTMQRMGVAINTQEILQRAIINTGIQQTNQITQAERATAALQIVTERLTRTFGEAGEASTQWKINRITAQARELRQEISARLFGVLGNLIDRLDDIIQRNEELAEILPTIFDTIDEGVALINELVNALDSGETGFNLFQRALEKVKSETEKLNRIFRFSIIYLHAFRIGSNALFESLFEGLSKITGPLGRFFGLQRDINESLTEFFRERQKRAYQDLQEAVMGIAERAGWLKDEVEGLVDVSDRNIEKISQTITKYKNLGLVLIDLIDIQSKVLQKHGNLEKIISAESVATDLLGRGNKDLRISINEVDEALSLLNVRFNKVRSPELREFFASLIKDLEELRHRLSGTEDQMVDLSEFLNTTMANALSRFIGSFTDAFEEIGAGSGDFVRSVLSGFLQVIRGIGQTMIAQGVAMLMGTYTFGIPDPRGKALIVQGALLAATSSLATGFVRKGSGAGVGQTDGRGSVDGVHPAMGIQSMPANAGGSIGITARDLRNTLDDVKWEAYTETDGAVLKTVLRKVNDRDRRVGRR